MRLSTCKSCGQLVYFENTSCTRCGALLGFNAESMKVDSFIENDDGLLAPIEGTTPQLYKYCANGVQYNACNWVVNHSDENELCIACRLNRTIPDLSVDNNLLLWKKIEAEKRRLIYTLLELQLPLSPVDPDAPKLAFDFLADIIAPANSEEEGECVLTGHANGLITLNINEADSAYREKMRNNMSESYRTLLGHFR
ncbi:MAG: hypothetical protein EOP48_19670, partial [Sphingobacteriales bacterium]